MVDPEVELRGTSHLTLGGVPDSVNARRALSRFNVRALWVQRFLAQ